MNGKVRKCVVPGCWTRTSGFKRAGRTKASFHRMPLNDTVLTIRWLYHLGMDINADNMSGRVCGGHFAKESFYPRSRKLRPGVVPKPFQINRGAAAANDEDHDMSDDDWIDIEDDPLKLPNFLTNKKPKVTCPRINTQAKSVAIFTSSSSEGSDSTDSDSDRSELPEVPLLRVFPPDFPMDLLDFANLPIMTRNDETLSSEYESDELMDCSDEGASIEAPLLSANFPPSGIPSDSEKNQQEQTKGASNASAMEKPEISAEDLISELSQENLIDYNSRMMFEYFPDDTSSPLPQYSEESEDYDEEMEKFAVFLNYYAPRGYDYAEKKYGVVPPKAIVAGWYVTNDFTPGFSKESFEAIAAEQKSSPTQVFVHLLFDELRVEHDKMACDELEYINFGQGSLDDDMCVVKRVFVFIASSVTKRWKIPLGFLACDEMGSDKEIVANLIEICTILLLKTGVKVTGVTMPLDENIPAFTALGCKFQYPHAKSNFSLLDQEMVFFPDPADVLEIIRFSFQHYGPFIDGDGNEIEWMYLDNLLKLQEKEGAEMCKKTRAAQMYLTRKKIQTKLAVYTMHKSVADALEYFEDKLKLPEFKGACATANFVRIIAQSMELLNGRWNGQKIFSSENSMAIQAFIITVCTYIRSMRLRKGVRLLKSHQNTGFIGLVFALRSLPIIYVNAVHEHGLPFIRLDSFTKDPLELLFSICRSNTYFVRIRKFYNNYKDLSVHWQRKDMKSGEIVPADWLSALHAQTTKAAKAINYSDRYFKFSTRCVELPAEESPTNDFWDNFEALFRLPKASEYRKNVMRYIGGFIGHLLRNKLKCLDCGSALTGSYHGYRIMWQKKWQTIKYPNKGIKEICWLTERMINTHGFDAEKKSKRISMLVEREMIDGDVFASQDASHDVQHRLLLIRAVSELYYDIRRYYDDRDGPNATNKQSKKPIHRGRKF